MFVFENKKGGGYLSKSTTLSVIMSHQNYADFFQSKKAMSKSSVALSVVTSPERL